jgi:hypothetical protein
VPEDNQMKMALEYLESGKTQRDLLAMAAREPRTRN